MGKLAKVSEVAEELGVSRWVVYRLAREGTLPGVARIGKRRIVIRRDILEAWLREGVDASQKEKLNGG
jgi:excisionase family DNA binding protein